MLCLHCAAPVSSHNHLQIGLHCVQGKSGEDAALDALNARERKELADGQGMQGTPEHQQDRMSLDGSASPGSDVTTGPSMLQQCREVQCFEKLNCINEGTYGMVYRCSSSCHVHIHAVIICMCAVPTMC